MFAARKQPGKKDAPTVLYAPPVKKTEWVERVVAVPQTRQTLDERLKQNKLKRRREREAAEQEESEKYRKISEEASSSSIAASNANAGISSNGKLRRATSANGKAVSSDDDDDDIVLESRRWKVVNEEVDAGEHPLYAKKYIGPLKVTREHLAATVGPAPHGNVISGRRMVENNRTGYEKYFPDLEEDTIATLELPGIGGSEQYLLLRPKVKDGHDYHPLYEIINVVRIICDFFLQPEQALSIFRHVKATSNFDFLNQSAKSLLRKNSRTNSPTPDLLSVTRASTPGSDIGTPEPSSFGDNSANQSSDTSIESLAASFGKDSVVRSLDKAFRRKNGTAFLSALAWFNAGIISLKRTNSIHANIEELGRSQGVPESVWQSITLQCYERTVGPRIDKLKKYAAFSDNTYGELLAPLLAHIAGTIGLNEKKVLVDLGSGVGNCCAQLSLATGCTSYGIENQVDASDMAREQTNELQARCTLWGLQCGSVEVHEANFLESPHIVEPILAKADVVLVNNFVFSPVTNERLSLMFPALKEGAQIVSLRPFCERPGAASISDRNENAIESILIQSKPIEFGRRHVSWTDEGGRYYIATVDRSRRRAFEEAKELAKMRS